MVLGSTDILFYVVVSAPIYSLCVTLVDITSRQLQFLDLLKNFVLEKGDVSKRNLIESPFTMIHPEGIRGIFNQKEIDEILNLMQQVLAT